MIAIQGIALFAFIPAVLFLYLRQPLGPGVSIAVGIVLMFGHRFIAAPWMRRHATERCLWCGREVRDKRVRLSVDGREFAACTEKHMDHSARFLTFVSRFRAPIATGIFVPLLLLLAGSLAQAAGHPFIALRWNTWQFRTIVAFTVVVTSFAYLAVRPSEPLRSAFPLHNLFLLGISNTLRVFRGVGAWWLIAGALQLLQ